MSEAMVVHGPRRRTRTILIALFVASLACSDAPTAPAIVPRTQIAAPAISGISLTGSLVPGGTIGFSALAADAGYQMPDASYFPMMVWSNNGENEVVQAHSLSCFDEADRVYVCNSFRMRIDTAADPNVVLTAATAADARIVRGDWWPDSASFYAFGNLESTMRSLRRRAGVLQVGYWYRDSIGIDPNVFARYAEATLRFDAGTPTPHDGRFTANLGDSVFASVLQPSGGTVTYEFRLW